MDIKIDPELSSLGLDEQKLRTTIELKFQQNGIKVLSKDELLNTLGNPSLFVHVAGYGGWLYEVTASVIQIHFRQRVKLYREQSCEPFAITWGNEYICKHLSTTDLCEKVNDQIDIFINDYLKANPKSDK